MKGFIVIIELMVVVAALAMAGCDTNLVTKEALAPPCKGNGDCPHILSYEPSSAKPGDTVTIRGTRFRGAMTLLIDGQEVVPKMKSINEGSFVVPEGRPGALSVVAKHADTAAEQDKFLRLAADFPVYTGDIATMCVGVQFYNGDGQLQEGTKDCDGPEVCTESGQTDCISSGQEFQVIKTSEIAATDIVAQGTSAAPVLTSIPTCSADGGSSCVVDGTTYKAASVASLSASNIKSGVTIAGVTGSLVAESHSDCSADGGTGCIATTSYPAANATSLASKVLTGQTVAGVSGTAGGEVHSDCTADGVVGCVTTSSYKSADMSVAVAANINTGVTIAGVAGSLGGTPACSSQGQQSCVATGSYYAATACSGDDSNCFVPSYVVTTQPLKAISYDYVNTNKAGVRSSLTIGGVAGTLADCAANGADDCFANSSSSYDAADLTNLAAGNIKNGVTIAGTTGNVVETPANCSSQGSQSCVATGSYYAATACSGDDSNCFVPSYVVTTQPLKAISYDYVNANKAGVRSSLTIGGVAGTLADCAANGADDCFANSSSSYDAADLTNLAAGNIKRGIAIAGTTGTYPSSTAPLLRYSDNGATTNTTGSDETDLTNFITQMTSAGTFEFWDSQGVRYTGSGDADIASANVATGTAFENLSITGSATVLTQCTSGVQGTCESDTACRWTGAACEINPWHIRAGITIASKAGSAKMNCRNRVNDTIYNSDSMPPGNGVTTAGSTVDWWDTIDNWNNNASTLPTQQPSGWSTNNSCGKEIWSDVTADGACDSAADDCMMKDNVTGLIWSESYPVTGTAAADTTADWSVAVQKCNDLSYGSRTDWRLPTQMEWMEAYNHGIRELGYNGAGTIRPGADTLTNNDYFISDTDQPYWSVSARSYYAYHAWYVYPHEGYTHYNTKAYLYRFVCVAP